MVTYREFVKENYPKLPAGMKATEKIKKIASMWRASGHSKKRATKVKGGNLTPGTVLTHSLGEGLNRGRGRPRKVKGGSESLEEHMIACGLGKDKLVSKITTKLEGGELDSDSDSEHGIYGEGMKKHHKKMTKKDMEKLIKLLLKSGHGVHI